HSHVDYLLSKNTKTIILKLMINRKKKNLALRRYSSNTSLTTDFFGLSRLRMHLSISSETGLSTGRLHFYKKQRVLAPPTPLGLPLSTDGRLLRADYCAD